MLNVETRFEVPRIVQALKARGHGTLCFYGAPGTGKTALAEHIARALERPLIIKQASDLMSKFVGETEQNMAAMFREAESPRRPCCCWTRPTAFCRTAAARSAPTR
jgi:SpoVK/Ycf46/Vps4 family AAA+-type ATPase